MAWRRTGDKPSPEPMLTQLNWRIYAALGGDELRCHEYFSTLADVMACRLSGAWTKAGIFPNGTLVIKCSEMWVNKILLFFSQENACNITSAHCRSFCLGPNALRTTPYWASGMVCVERNTENPYLPQGRVYKHGILPTLQKQPQNNALIVVHYC